VSFDATGAAAAGAAGKAGAAGAGANATGASSYCTTGVLTPLPRLSRILKSCFSSSNSETEFLRIKSMMALISFKSTAQQSLKFSCQLKFLPKKLGLVKKQRPNFDSAFIAL